MGGLLNNSVKMEKGYKLAGLATMQKHTALQKDKEVKAGAVNSSKAQMSDEKKAKAKAKAKQSKKDRKRNK
ncbi:hypothetical protein [Sulfurospirillum barnesii]|uniref:Uncharacterized protein n=1 Tax=Sulfurospirillum barnesii (strain ATCC 700032 / DSM 10660 / SES-3) TaxID=760154 RepID=I3XXH5_SULBS|nr:hypothetical protein [Sulfurospirillum barnesii]AFL68649.1 hypothetical protein Sulba_1360 [Sulfurospirillum barnesii SES-3]